MFNECVGRSGGDLLPVVVIGAGPAGLTAAYELTRRGIRAVVLEKSDRVGGIARTEVHKGYRFDIGGHRFFTKVPEVERLWNEVLPASFLKVARLSRIHYCNRFFNYPLELGNALANLGVVESILILLSYLRWKAFPHRPEDTFERWVINRFGRRLYVRFFKTYTEKVWGIPCDRIRADWAAQRIQGLSLSTAVWSALTGATKARTLSKEFHYPALGPGMMWERFRELVEAQGGEVLMGTETVAIEHRSSRVTSVTVVRDGRAAQVRGAHFLSSMPLAELVSRLDPPPPEAVSRAASKLSYRDFLLVGLILDRDRVFPDNWIYVHTPGFRVGRIQNFGNWSPGMVPEPGKTSVGMEYFCTEGDDFWGMRDDELVALAREELISLGLARDGDIEEGLVIRQPKAYPVYDANYRERLGVIRDYLRGLQNFQTIGRNGMHHYNNQDHSMLTAMLAVRNLAGEHHDLWEVNTERSHHEDVPSEARPPAQLRR
jgi:protoporphyrinogen oxidase